MSRIPKLSYAELHPKKKKKNKNPIVELEDGTKVDYQLCPGINCGHPIQKIGGCNYIKCKICKTQFCWLCKKIKGTGENECNDKSHNSH